MPLALRQAWLATWALAGILVSTATVVSLVKRGLSIPLYGTPKTSLETYEWIRNNIFDGFYLLIASLWTWRFPHWLEDVIAFYLFLGFTMNRTMLIVYGEAKRRTEQILTSLAIVLFWPIMLGPRYAIISALVVLGVAVIFGSVISLF